MDLDSPRPASLATLGDTLGDALGDLGETLNRADLDRVERPRQCGGNDPGQVILLPSFPTPVPIEALKPLDGALDGGGSEAD